MVTKLTLPSKENDVQTKINELVDDKQDTLVSGTNIKTINSNSLLGSGDLTIDSLPSQSGQSGKFLTTDGTSTSWGTPTSSATWGSITGTLSDQTDLNNALSGKADIDLSNVNSAGKSTGAGWAMPSNTYDELTFGASEATYRAPANGWFAASRKNTSTSSNYLNIINTSSGLSLSFVSDSTNNAEKKVFLPVRKNDVVEIGYGSHSSSQYLRFVYAEGENV